MTEPAARGAIRRRAAAWILGAALLAAAVAAAWTRQDALAEAWSAVRSPDPRRVALLLAAIAANVLCTGAMFLVLVRRYGRVGAVEMQALMAGATLLNYLPLRPGLIGRAAYHRRVHGIAISDVAKTVIQALAISAATAVFFALCVALAIRGGVSVAGPVVVVGVLLLVASAALPRPARPFALAAAIRYVEILLWAVRYDLAFDLVGAPIAFDRALGFACVGVVATMVPIVSNGLGLREWAIGLVAPLLAGADLGVGIAAELLARAAELLVVAPAGLLGLGYLAHRSKVAPDPDR